MYITVFICQTSKFTLVIFLTIFKIDQNNGALMFYFPVFFPGIENTSFLKATSRMSILFTAVHRVWIFLKCIQVLFF